MDDRSRRGSNRLGELAEKISQLVGKHDGVYAITTGSSPHRRNEAPPSDAMGPRPGDVGSPTHRQGLVYLLAMSGATLAARRTAPWWWPYLGICLLAAGCKNEPDPSATSPSPPATATARPLAHGDPGGGSPPVVIPDAWLRAYPDHHLSPLAVPPDWSQLDRYQETMSHREFSYLIDRVYTQEQSWRDLITIEDGRAVIRTSHRDPEPVYVLRFRTPRSPAGAEKTSVAKAKASDLALDGLTIAIDPGHIGGPWAQTEWRWFQIADAPSVAEGDLTLMVARILADNLRSHGARAILVRDRARPVAEIDPAALAPVARRRLIARDELHPGMARAAEREVMRVENARLTYRTAEIRARARRINDEIRPDLTLCLHFNAEQWSDRARKRLSDKNHAHVIVNGSYTAEELMFDDVRFDMLDKLLARTHEVEISLAREVARALAEATGLPGESYPRSEDVRPMSDDGYIWARNLLANRIYRGPVLYLEPYVMNSHTVHARIQAGDYQGLQRVAGKNRPSIFREYADAVTRGLVAYHRHRRTAD